MGSIAEREQIDDRQRLDPLLLDQLANGDTHACLVQRRDDAPVRRNPLGNADTSALRSEKHRRLCRLE